MSLARVRGNPRGSAAQRRNFSKGSRLKSLKVPTGVWGQDPIKQPYHTAGHNCVVENSEQRLLDKRIWGEIKKKEGWGQNGVSRGPH